MIERTYYLDFLKKLKGKQIIKVITGMRRAGKSTILTQYKDYLLSEKISKENIIYMNFEDGKNYKYLDWKSLYDYIESHLKKDTMYYIFLDEIQRVSEFEKCVNSLEIKPNVDLYITGSNSHMLSSELSTFLTGRYIELHVLPLSFKEYLSYYGENDKLEKYNKYIEFGGLPYLINLDDDETLIRNYIDSVYNTILMKDVVNRKKVNDPLILESIVRFLFDNIGNPISTKKISDTLSSNGRKNSVHTIESYLNSLLESYLLYRVNRYDIKGKQLLKTQEKYYLSDIGFRTYLLGKNRTQDLGHILENVIFLELKRKGYKIYIGKNDENEVDFIVENHKNISYVQVALTVRGENTLNRELKPLLDIKDNYPKYLITLDYDNNDYDGIKQISAIDFLTDKTDL